MELGERLKKIRGHVSQKEFSALFDVTANTLRRYETGVNPPTTDFVLKVCKKFNKNPMWLLLGDGNESSLEQSISSNQADIKAPQHSTPTDAIPTMPSDEAGLGKNIKLLAKIHDSGNTVLIRAIAANLHAFSEAIDNKELAKKAIDMMDEMNQRLLIMERSLEELKKENEELRKRPPGCSDQAVG